MLYSKLSQVVFSSHVFCFLAFPFSPNQSVLAAVPVPDDSIACMVPARTNSKIQLNRYAVKYVRTYIKKNNEDLVRIREKSDAPFKTMDLVFRQYGLPVELKYLAVIESELNPRAVSRVGAAGPWQLMPATAKILGLKITSRYDERKQFSKSTKAAALYLRDLYSEFGDWLLVMAAYNCGPGPVYHAIHRSGSHNFWNLQAFLPGESREHVKKYIATHYYFEGQGSATTLTKAEYIRYNKMLIEEQLKQGFPVAEQKASNVEPFTPDHSVAYGF